VAHPPQYGTREAESWLTVVLQNTPWFRHPAERANYRTAAYNRAVNETQTWVINDVILAAGGVLCRHASEGDEILIVHRKRYGDWTLPKGKLQNGESFLAAALREIEEETGCTVRPEKYLGAIGYEVNGKPKAVLFWRMSLVAQKEIEDLEEVAEVVWMPLKKAVQRLTHPDEKALILRAC
jgi:8-oxo-dGTP pyrophosphatase MutT (NUDIX family)